MSVTLDIDVDTTGFSRSVGILKSQVPFATAKAMADTLLDMQEDQRKHMKRVFTIRRERFAMRSVKISKFPKKRDLVGVIEMKSPGSAHNLFAKFEEGGIHRARESRRIAIPTDKVGRGKTGVIPRSKRPQQLISRGKGFIINTGGQDVVLVKKGPRRNRTTTVNYLLEPFVKIPAILDFKEITLSSFDRNWQRNFARRFDQAVATAK